MILPNEERNTAVVYTSGVCNLNCRYCNIDKNPALLNIDNLLEESFKGDYYFDRIKAYMPKKYQLRRLETWGGEPFLHMDRIYPLVDKLINYYPYFDTMFSSTNFSYNEWLDQFLGLMECFRPYPYRNFTFELQLSVDGPMYINDANRGNGVTEKCIKNFEALLKAIGEGKLPPNVKIACCIKGTLDLDGIHKLNDKQKIIEFFQFYENAYIDKVYKLNHPQITMGAGIPNTAAPAPTTVEDGKIFAEFVKKCRELESENYLKHYFKYHQSITPYGQVDGSQLNINYRTGQCQTCGTGGRLLGFLPNNLVSACHEGFTLMIDEYKKYQRNRSDKDLTVSLNAFKDDIQVPMCLDDDQYVKHEQKMQSYQPFGTARIATDVVEIMALAMAGQVDKCYLDECNALYAAVCLAAICPYCIKNSHVITGSFTIQPTDLFKLLLNGALPYLINGGTQCNGQQCSPNFRGC